MTEHTRFIKLKDKKETRVVRYVYEATSNDPARPVLSGILINKDVMVAADGFLLTIVPTPESIKENEELHGKVWGFSRKPTITPRPLEITLVEGTFPDYEQILPDDDAPVIFQYALDPQRLKTFAQIPNPFDTEEVADVVFLDFYGTSRPVVIKSGEDETFKSLLMPMHMDDPKGGINEMEERVKQLEIEAAELRDQLEDQWVFVMGGTVEPMTQDTKVNIVDLDELDAGFCPICGGEPAIDEDNVCESCGIDWSKDHDELIYQIKMYRKEQEEKEAQKE